MERSAFVLAPVLIALAPLAWGAEPLRILIVEREGSGKEVPVPARVHLAGPDGKPVRAEGLPFFHDHFDCPGEAHLRLPAGTYRYVVERGPEYRRASGEVRTGEGSPGELRVLLERTIDMKARGWWSGETHVHRGVEDLPLLLRAEDLHLAPVMTIWNRKSHWKDHPLPERLLAEAEPERAYHLLGAEDERRGGALLFLNLKRPLLLEADGPEHPSPRKHCQEARADPEAWIDVEKPFWWDAPTWVALGLADSIGLANNHMCRSSMYEDEAWGRPRDARRLPAPRGNGFYTQEIYYRFLNCGFRIPPSAGSASGVLPNPVGYNRVYVRLEGGFTYQGWWRALAAGRAMVTNGPLLLVAAAGRPPGETFRAPEGRRFQAELEVLLEGNDPIETVEVIQDGEAIQALRGEDLRGRPGLKPVVFEKSGWFLVRAIARVSQTFRFASTAPYYVEIGGRQRRVHRTDVDYFLAWITERMEQIRGLADLGPRERDEVLAPHREALEAFRGLLEKAE
jgi:hypothetical protein